MGFDYNALVMIIFVLIIVLIGAYK
jgi:hypothetical protein